MGFILYIFIYINIYNITLYLPKFSRKYQPCGFLNCNRNRNQVGASLNPVGALLYLPERNFLLYFLKNKIKTNFFLICLVVSKIIITFAPTTNETPVSLVNQERWMLHESQNIIITNS
jgi:hypothetical protein